MTVTTESPRPRLLARVVPAPLRDPAQRPRLLGWLGIGLAIRLVLAPFTISADLLAVYWRAHLIAYEGDVFESYLVNMGAHYVHALWLRLVDVVMIPREALWTDPWYFDDFIPLAPQVLRDLSATEGIHATLVALKTPYILADLGAGAIILAMVAASGPAAVRRAWVFWMLSPIGIYASVVWGRYEALAIVVVVAAVWATERGRPWTAALLLGLAVTVRSYPLLLVPILALVAPHRDGAATTGATAWLRTGAWAAVAVAPLLVVSAVNALIAGTAGELAQLGDFRTGSTFTALTVPLDGPGDLLVYVGATLVLWGVLAGCQWGWWGAPQRAEHLWLWLIPAHLAMFALAPFGAHWFAWVTPFVALGLARRPEWRGLLALHLVSVVVALALSDVQAGPDTLLGTFIPASQAAASLPSLRELLLTSGSAEVAVSALRTAFLALSVLVCVPVIAELRRGARTTAVEPTRTATTPADHVR